MRARIELPYNDQLTEEAQSMFGQDIEDALDEALIIAGMKHPTIPEQVQEELITLGMRSMLEVIDDCQGSISFMHGDEARVFLFDGLADHYFGKINS